MSMSLTACVPDAPASAAYHKACRKTGRPSVKGMRSHHGAKIVSDGGPEELRARAQVACSGVLQVRAGVALTSSTPPMLIRMMMFDPQLAKLPHGSRKSAASTVLRPVTKAVTADAPVEAP
jgi:hypothetical protein